MSEKVKEEVIIELDKRYVKKETETDKLKKRVKELEDAKKKEGKEEGYDNSGADTEGEKEDLFNF